MMGSAAAWALARRGVDVVLLEQFGPGHTLGASHGSARIYRSSYAQPHHQALVAEARELWGELEQESGVRVLHPAPGVTTAEPAGLPRLREVAAALTAAGVPHEWLSAGEAEQRWPGMRFPGPVLFEPATAGRVDADTAVTALQGAAAGHGAVVRHHRRVTAVEVDGDGVLVRSAAGAAVRAHGRRGGRGVDGPRAARCGTAAVAGHPGAAGALPAAGPGRGVAGLHRRPRSGRRLAERHVRVGHAR